MAAAPDPFHEFVRELLAGCGPVAIKRMFGGAGVYAEGRMFGLIADDVLHLKVDDALKRDLAAEGSAPFIWTPASGPRAGEAVDMGYWKLPDAALDEPDLAVLWARRAISVAHAAAAAKRPKRKKGG
jgi:DNA transformation protein and related proteins